MTLTIALFSCAVLAQAQDSSIPPAYQPTTARAEWEAVTTAPTDWESVTTAPVLREPAPLHLLPSLIDVELRLDRNNVAAGRPVMAEFVIRNKTLEPVTLQVPQTDVNREEPIGMGLPLEHVFSGERFRALQIAAEGNSTLGDRKVERPDYPVPLITIEAMGVVGLRCDLARLYPVLHQPGKYDLKWSPYAGAVTTAVVPLEVITYKIVALDTTQGRLMLRLFYEKAPQTVGNFLDLVRSRFYDGKAFHRIQRDFAIAGGCPLGNGTGRRPDGKTIPPEFNDTPFEAGTLGMSLTRDDPNSGSCQFFITLTRLPALDGHYTAFAQVEGPESLDTLRRIANVELDANKRPLQPVKIKSAVILDASSLR